MLKLDWISILIINKKILTVFRQGGGVTCPFPDVLASVSSRSPPPQEVWYSLCDCSKTLEYRHFSNVPLRSFHLFELCWWSNCLVATLARAQRIASLVMIVTGNRRPWFLIGWAINACKEFGLMMLRFVLFFFLLLFCV